MLEHNNRWDNDVGRMIISSGREFGQLARYGVIKIDYVEGSDDESRAMLLICDLAYNCYSRYISCWITDTVIFFQYATYRVTLLWRHNWGLKDRIGSLYFINPVWCPSHDKARPNYTVGYLYWSLIHLNEYMACAYDGMISIILVVITRPCK